MNTFFSSYKGFTKIKVNGTLYNSTDEIVLEKNSFLVVSYQSLVVRKKSIMRNK